MLKLNTLKLKREVNVLEASVLNSGLCWSLCILNLDLERQKINDVNTNVCMVVGAMATNKTTLNLRLLSQKRRPISLGFYMTSEKHTSSLESSFKETM